MSIEPEQRVRPVLTDYLFSKASSSLIPLGGTFELTPTCNFKCRMCYVRKSEAEVRKSPRARMEFNEWLKLAAEARDQGMLYLLLTGGEPLIWPHFWDLYEKLIDMGFLISINTNGSLIDEEVIARFKEKPPVRINITLYGASDQTYKALCGVSGVLNKVDQAIKGLKRAGIQVKLNASLTPYNIGDLDACAAYAVENGLIYTPVSYMFPPLRRDESLAGQNERFTPEEAALYSAKSYHVVFGDEYYRKRMQQIHNGAIPPPGLDEGCIDPVDGRVRCRAGKASFWITWDGYMTPCGMMTKPKADLRKLTFKEAWDQLTEDTASIRLSGICSKCPDQNLCHSCAAMELAENGEFGKVPTYLCEMVKAMKKHANSELERFNNESNKA